ncbi:hypothetical protein, partial [Pseudomonas aeruginosa]|uniref:hypothetical protein n=1 Tax=Pseudomonas aeruginosa TaxID=287 RepID=UPI001ABD2003
MLCEQPREPGAGRKSAGKRVFYQGKGKLFVGIALQKRCTPEWAEPLWEGAFEKGKGLRAS